MKLNNNHKLFYAEHKLKLRKTISVHALINAQIETLIETPDAFKTDKYNAYKIIASNFKRLNNNDFHKKLFYFSHSGATPQMRKAASRVRRKLLKIKGSLP